MKMLSVEREYLAYLAAYSFDVFFWTPYFWLDSEIDLAPCHFTSSQSTCGELVALMMGCQPFPVGKSTQVDLWKSWRSAKWAHFRPCNTFEQPWQV
jgi:hypothetical protein